jgi:hypothetical protein
LSGGSGIVVVVGGRKVLLRRKEGWGEVVTVAEREKREKFSLSDSFMIFGKCAIMRKSVDPLTDEVAFYRLPLVNVGPIE